MSENEEVKVKEESSDTETRTETVIKFKKKPKKNLRQRLNVDEEENDNETAVIEASTLEEIKERQRLRQRQKGVNVAGLALGNRSIADDDANKDSLKAVSGGLVNMKSVKAGAFKDAEDPYEITIGTQFSAETNKRDEDEEMMKYIEIEMAKRKGIENAAADEDNDGKRYITPEDAALLALPEHLRQSSSIRSEEMLSNQMLNGIPEVDLGIDAKIRNIEATEEAKLKLLEDQKKRKEGPSEFVPSNMAVNFMQHNRFNIDDSTEQKKRKHDAREHYGPNGIKRSTDDFVYDRFKKQFKRC